MIKSERVFEILKRTEAVLEGHFKLSNGKHTREYIQCAKAFQWGNYGEEIAKAIAGRFKGREIHIVIGPALGGVLLAYEVGRILGVKTIFAEKEDGAMTLRRGFEIPRGSKVLIVEDVVVTGSSVREVMDLVINAGANPVGIACVTDISSEKLDFVIDFQSLMKLELKKFNEEDCPMCRAEIPLLQAGSNKII